MEKTNGKGRFFFRGEFHHYERRGEASTLFYAGAKRRSGWGASKGHTCTPFRFGIGEDDAGAGKRGDRMDTAGMEKKKYGGGGNRAYPTSNLKQGAPFLEKPPSRRSKGGNK